MKKIQMLKAFINDKSFRFSCFEALGFCNNLDDEQYLKRAYKAHTGAELNLNNPVGYTEKLQWLKLYNRNPGYSTMVDKASAKEFAAMTIGREFIVPSIGVYDDFADIDIDALPERFVIKCTHDSNSTIVCKDKDSFDFPAAEKKLRGKMKINYYLRGREWPYKSIKPRIIIEQYLKDEKDGELRDYKFFCFNGEPKVLYITQGRGVSEPTVADFFDMDFNHLDMRIDHETADVLPHKPLNFELMKELAAKLSDKIPHVRVDFYEVNGRVFFGEMTFFHCSGFKKVSPPEWERKMGEWIVLPEKQT